MPQRGTKSTKFFRIYGGLKIINFAIAEGARRVTVMGEAINISARIVSVINYISIRLQPT